MADIVTAVHEVGETDVDTVGIRSKDHMQWLRAVDDSGKTVFFSPSSPVYRVSLPSITKQQRIEEREWKTAKAGCEQICDGDDFSRLALRDVRQRDL